MYHHRLCNHLYINYGTNYTPYEKQVLLEKKSVFEKFQLVKWNNIHVKW